MFQSLPFFRAIAGVAVLALATACSSSGSNNPTPSNSTPKGMSWTINGTAVSTTQTRVDLQPSSVPSGYIEVVGAYNTTAASTGVDLVMPKAVGTYAVTDSIQNGPKAAYVVAALSAGGSSLGMFGHVGTITVSSVTATEIVGTFNFTGDSFVSGGATTTQTITNGKFNVTL
jgi:hypothetical protein